MLFPLRASNEAFQRACVPGARKQHGSCPCPSHQFSSRFQAENGSIQRLSRTRGIKIFSKTILPPIARKNSTYSCSYIRPEGLIIPLALT